MPLTLIRNDITKMTVDGVVCPSNSELRPDGGVSAQLFAAAGEAMDVACQSLRPLAPGSAGMTRGFRLPTKFVLHTVGPVWQGGGHGERQILEACYRNCLKLAKKHRLESIAFPLISAGSYGYPTEAAMAVASQTIRQFLEEQDLDVYLVLFDREAALIGGQRHRKIQSYIDDHYVDLHRTPYSTVPRQRPMASVAAVPMARPMAQPVKKRTLEELLGQLDESFSQMLLRLIDEKGMTDVEVYKRANIDRKLFSKIRKSGYNPSKPTAIALAIALRLNLDETRDLLAKAGYALSGSSKFDVIILYFIESGNYDIFEINETLFAFDQKLLGA